MPDTLKMGLGNQISPRKRNKIIGAHENRVSLTEISNNYDIPYSTVKYTWAARNWRPPTSGDKRRSGAPRKISPSTSVQLYRRTREQPSVKIGVLRSELRQDDLEVSRRTIQRDLSGYGGHFHKYRAPKGLESHVRVLDRG